MADIRDRIASRVLSMKPYEPVEAWEEWAPRVGRPVKLDGNENPYGCSPRVRRALAEYDLYHIYPDPDQTQVRRALASYVGLGEEYLVAGSGSDELIDLTLRLFLEPGDRVINLPPTFGMYPLCAGLCGGEVVEVEREEDFSVDLGRVKRAIDGRTKLIFIASPNNPSGNVFPLKDLRELLDTGIVVVVDEAYYEFCGVTAASLVPEYANLIVLRTFSKWAGLAGLRAGYGIFPPQVVSYILRIKQPYNLNRAAQVAILESLGDLDYLKGRVAEIVRERERLYERLRKMPGVTVFPSQANFLLFSLPRGKAKEVHRRLKERGILLRYFDVPRLRDCLRVSVGRPEDDDIFLEALEEVLTELEARR